MTDSVSAKARQFSADDQRIFARLSGDANPIHVDDLFARRVFSGQIVVHGIHLLLSALDLIARTSDVRSLASVVATFESPVGIDETAEFVISQPAPDRASVDVSTARGRGAHFDFVFRSAPAPASLSIPSSPTDWPVELKALVASDIDGRSGRLPLALDGDALIRLFPSLGGFDATQVAQLLATTQLVGMECPGLHSIFAGLQLEFDGLAAGDGAPPELAYAVDSFDRRFSITVMSVTSPGLRGKVRAFLRPAPIEQPSFVMVRKQVTSGEFTGVRALVVGGTRGLGEVAAKLLAAGGAAVTITYQRGEADARRVADEVGAAGFSVAVEHCDVLNPSGTAPGSLAPTHVFYFATPRIVTGARTGFSFPLFIDYCKVYVDGLLGTLVAFSDASLRGLAGVYCPSSVYVDKFPPGLGEYAAAKAAAETLCASLRQSYPRLKVLSPRLPRLRTDQTAAVMSAGFEESAPVLLRHFRELIGPRA